MTKEVQKQGDMDLSGFRLAIGTFNLHLQCFQGSSQGLGL